MMTKKISKNVLIIGGSSSIGSDVVEQFNNSKNRVMTTFNSSNPVLIDGVENFQLDLTSNKSIERCVKEIKSKIMSLDTIIFLSGILPGKSLDHYEMDEITQVFNINFIGQSKLYMKLLDVLSERSSTIMLSSISAQRGSFDPIYAASKSAVNGFVKSMFNKLPKKSRINCIAPGLINNSKMFNDMSKERQKFHQNQIPSNSLLESKDLAKIIYDISQDHWIHLNGACIDLNGGQHVR